ncbi:hypothetical protein H4S08_004447 [Coemansia sp. RSA 1365]|nr:hypothetical protein H4S08_004447 [Coemansia sp. RSA 1365]
MNEISNIHKFAVLRENSSAQEIHTWICAWEVRGQTGISLLNNALMYVNDNILVCYDRWQQDANTTAGDTFATLKTFLQGQMGLGMTESGAALELMTFLTTDNICQFNDLFLHLAQEAGFNKIQGTVGLYAMRMPLSLRELIMTRPTQPSLQEAMNLIRVHVESVQATYKHADPSTMVVAALEDLGSFAGLQITKAKKKVKPTTVAAASGAKHFEMLRKVVLKRRVTSKTFDAHAASNECVMCRSTKHKASQCTERQGNAN